MLIEVRRSLSLLPRTGQTISYPNGDASDRDDGHYRAGRPGGSRFVDLSDGTVYDRATGLIWVIDPSQCGGAFGTPGSPATMLWLDAIAACEGLTYAGCSDWRLPNVVEMDSIYNYALANGLYTPFVIASTAVSYWSSNTRIANTTQAFGVRHDTAATRSVYAKATSQFYVRPVRGGRVNV